MTTRRPHHTRAQSRITYAFEAWFERCNAAGCVDVGEVRCRLRRDPMTIVGIDVAVWLGVEYANLESNPSCYDGPPAIAVEVLSASDTHEATTEKVQLYLATGVRQVWVADPVFQTVTVYRPDRVPELFASTQELTAEPELPGFRVPVVRLFVSSICE